MIWQALVGAVSKLFLFVAMLASSWFGGKKTAQADAKVEWLRERGKR
jgi:NADH:ubiquinone oxidoreductase subunit 6 (subunit J)